MSVDERLDERLRETLVRRAELVEAPPDAWFAITRRIERRQQRARTVSLSLVAGMSVAAVALAVVMATIAGPEARDQDLAATGPSSGLRTSTTYSPFAVPTTPSDGPAALGFPAIPPGPDTPGAGPGGEPGPVPPPTVEGGQVAVSGATVTGYRVGGVWPETQGGLMATVAGGGGGSNQGQETWWQDPTLVAAAFLDSRGLTTSGDGAPRSVGEANVLRYMSGGVGGWITVGQPQGGNTFYVDGSRSDRIVQLRAVRQNDRLVVDVRATESGRVILQIKRPGATDWLETVMQVAAAGQPSTITIGAAGGGDVILQVRHEGDDGKVGISDQFLGAGVASLEYEGLHDGSLLGPAWLGTVNLGATLSEAERVAGIAMEHGTAGDCATLQPVGRPAGVRLVAFPGSDRVDEILVSAPGVRTTADIAVGSTADEVLEAYPTAEGDVSDGTGRFVYRPADSVLGGHEMVFDLTDGRVVSIAIGGTGLSTAESSAPDASAPVAPVANQVKAGEPGPVRWRR